MQSHSRTTSPPPLEEGLALHFTSLAVLLAALLFGWNWIDRPQAVSFAIATAIPIIHQVYVWIAWRKALHQRLQMRFRTYLIWFFILFGSRIVSLAHLAGIDETKIGVPEWVRFSVVGICAVISGYAFYSVARYFGFKRAAGADHFDPAYRNMPLVSEGIFRFTNNGMYIYAFMIVWLIPFFFDSLAALLVAGFSHAYIWVHYFATEKPDMQYLYES